MDKENKLVVSILQYLTFIPRSFFEVCVSKDCMCKWLWHQY